MLVDGAIIGTAKAAVEGVDFVVKRPSRARSRKVADFSDKIMLQNQRSEHDATPLNRISSRNNTCAENPRMEDRNRRQQ
jgi:hypothetical protein